MIVLLLLPLLTYFISYGYLAWYHQDLTLFNRIVHESGAYTLLESTFFASHFLGHVPVHTALAFLFVGTFLNLHTLSSSTQIAGVSKQGWSAALALFLIFSLTVSLSKFGLEDTLAFILQRRQRVGSYTTGGSWNLHLPSTLLMSLLIPPYIYFFSFFFKRKITPSWHGARYVFIGALIVLVMTIIVNLQDPSALLSVATDPRYQGHSVREVATFSITYLPIPLYLFLRGGSRADGLGDRGCVLRIVFFSGVIFLLLFGYQIYQTLAAGVGNLAQVPAFANKGSLSIPYLLASHYFEHFLDTVYFGLLCLLLFTAASTGSRADRRVQ